MDRNIDESIRKPRKTKGTPSYRYRNYFALAIFGFSTVSFIIFNYLGVSKKVFEQANKYLGPPVQKDSFLARFKNTSDYLDYHEQRQKKEALKIENSKDPIIKEKISSYFPIISQENNLEPIAEDIKESRNKFHDLLVEKPLTNSDKKLILNTSDDSIFSTKEIPKSQSKIFQIDKITKVTKRKVKKNCSVGDVESLTKRSSGSFDLDHVQLALALSNSLQNEVSTQDQDEKTVLSSQQKLQNLKETLQQFGFNTGNTSSGLSLGKAPTQKRKKKLFLRTTLLIRSEKDRKRIIEKKVSEILTNIASYNEYKDKNSPPIEIFDEKPHSFSLREICWQNAPLYKKSSLTFESQNYFNSLVKQEDCVKTGSLLKDWHKIPGREKTPPREIKNNSEKTKGIPLQNESSKNSPKSITNDCQLSKPKELVLRTESPDLFSDDSCDYVIQKEENLSPDIFTYENFNEDDRFPSNNVSSSEESLPKFKNQTKDDVIDLTQACSSPNLDENAKNDTVIKEIISKTINSSQNFELSHEYLDLIYDLANSPQNTPESPQKSRISSPDHQETCIKNHSHCKVESIFKDSKLDPINAEISQELICDLTFSPQNAPENPQKIKLSSPNHLKSDTKNHLGNLEFSNSSLDREKVSKNQVLTCFSSDSEVDSFLNSSTLDQPQLEIEQNHIVLEEQNISLLNVSGRTNFLINEQKSDSENEILQNNTSVIELKKKLIKTVSCRKRSTVKKTSSKRPKTNKSIKNHNDNSASSSSDTEKCCISPKKGSNASVKSNPKYCDQISASSCFEVENDPIEPNCDDPNLKNDVPTLILSPDDNKTCKRSPEVDLRSENQSVFDFKRLKNVRSALVLTNDSFLQNLDDFGSFNLSDSVIGGPLEGTIGSLKQSLSLNNNFDANKIDNGRKRSISLISSDSEVENNCSALSQGASECLLNDVELNYSCYRSNLKLYRSGSKESISSESSDQNEDNLQPNLYKSSENEVNDESGQNLENLTSKSPNSSFQYNDLDHFADQLAHENVYNNPDITSKYQDIDNKSLNHRRISELKGNVTPLSKSRNLKDASICEQENILDKTPDNKSGSPGPELIIKTSNVTPIVNYNELDTPQRNKELDKYGLKPMPKGKSVKILEYLYNVTHPVYDDENDVETQESSSDEDNENEPASKRRKVGKKEKYISNRAVRKRKSQQLFIHKDTEEPIALNFAQDHMPQDEMIFEKVFSKKIASCALPFHIAWHNFISTQPGLKEAILLYEPIQLEEIYLYFKNLGFKYHIQDIQTFLDRKCITIRTAQNNR